MAGGDEIIYLYYGRFIVEREVHWKAARASACLAIRGIQPA